MIIFKNVSMKYLKTCLTLNGSSDACLYIGYIIILKTLLFNYFKGSTKSITND